MLLSLLAKLCCVCPPSGVRYLEAAGTDAHSQPCSRKLPLQQSKVFLSLLFPVCSLFLWIRHFPRSQLTPKVRPWLCVCRGWEGVWAGKEPSLHLFVLKGPTSSTRYSRESSKGRRRHAAAMGLPDFGNALWNVFSACMKYYPTKRS